MASNRTDLIKRAEELAEALGNECPSAARMSNTEIAKLVAELEDKQLTAEIDAEGVSEKAEREAREKAEREAKIRAAAEAEELRNLNRNANPYRGRGLRFAHQVAPRRQLQCRRGVLLAGAEVRPEFVGGPDALEALVHDGVVLRRSEG